jgi:hypothetical protein
MGSDRADSRLSRVAGYRSFVAALVFVTPRIPRGGSSG